MSFGCAHFSEEQLKMFIKNADFKLKSIENYLETGNSRLIISI